MAFSINLLNILLRLKDKHSYVCTGRTPNLVYTMLCKYFFDSLKNIGLDSSIWTMKDIFTKSFKYIQFLEGSKMSLDWEIRILGCKKDTH